MPRKPARPKPFRVTGTDVRVRVAEGPREDGRWRWRADRQDGDKRPTVWSGWATQEEAERAVLASLEERTTAESSNELVTVEDLLSAWTAAVDDRADLSPMTARRCTDASKRLLQHGLGVVRLDRLDRRAIERHRDAALRGGEDGRQAGSTVMRDLKYLRQAWTWAREIGEVADRELPRVKVERRARAPVYTRYTPTRAEIGRMLGAVRPEWVRRSLVLLAATGARIGEVATLTWGRVAADGTTIEVHGKTGPRVVPLHPTVARELRSWDRGPADAPVLGVGEKYAVVKTQRELARVSGELRVGGRVSPNGLRRAMTDALYDSGAGPDVEAALLGHSAQTALDTYRKVREARGREAVLKAGITIPGLGVGGNEVIPFPGPNLSANLSGVAEVPLEPEEEYSQGEDRSR